MIYVSPNVSTVRGATEVVVHGDPLLLDTSNDAALVNGVPSGWTPSGNVRQYSTQGLMLSAGSSSATLTSSTSFLHFDFAVDIDLFDPDASAAVFEAATLEIVVGTSVARVSLKRYPDKTVQAEGSVTITGITYPAGVVVVKDVIGQLTLRIVRTGEFVWGFIGRRDDLGRYSEVIPVMDYNQFVTGAAVPRIAVRNGTSAAGARTIFRNFTVRSHATINGRLLENKLDAELKRIVGNVPAAHLTEVGTASIKAFGPWGVSENVSGFEYTRPTPNTVSFDGTRSLITFTDPVLHD